MRVGLTGSIAVGKTFVDDVFRELGVPVLDADQVARDVVAPGTIGLQRVAEQFGESVLKPDASLDRAKLGSIVFADEEKRLRLNSIIHPLVFEAQDIWLRKRELESPDGIAIVDAADPERPGALILIRRKGDRFPIGTDLRIADIVTI